MRIACGSALEVRKTFACGSGNNTMTTACGSALEKIKYRLRLRKKRGSPAAQLWKKLNIACGSGK
jgi:hypothetical protein